MKWSMQRIAEATLGICILGLGVMLAVPGQARGPQGPSSDERLMPVEPDPDVSAAASLPSPEELAAIFVGGDAFRQPTTPVRTAPPRPAVDAAWIRFIGYSRASDGALCFFFKDTRSAKLFTVIPGAASEGWTLVENSKDRIILSRDDQRYVVSKGRQ